MPAKLRCFVAMAFGQKDTDAKDPNTRHITFHVLETADRLTRLSEILAERFPYRVTSKNG